MTVPDHILELDHNDDLAHLRAQFDLPDGVTYLDGNSLGPVCQTSKVALKQVQQEWQNDLISSWNTHSWIDLPTIVGEKVAPLIGAAPGQTICCDSTSVNLFKVLVAALSLQSGRTTLVSEYGNFPSDLYMLEGLQALLGEKRIDIKLVETRNLEATIDDSVAVVILTHVNFKTGAKHDMARINQLAHQHGALIIWDLAHSTGAFPVELDATKTDFAVGCGYKYLNGGPGAPAFVYAATKHHAKIKQPLTGWMGHATPFAFDMNYIPANGVEQFLTGTPPILTMVALEGALEVFSGVDLNRVEEKSIALQHTFLEGLGEQLIQYELVTPLDESHGSQLCLAHQSAYQIAQNMIAEQVIVDFREPNILRLGFAPLYLSHAQCWQAGKLLANIMTSKTYLLDCYQVRNKQVRNKVT